MMQVVPLQPVPAQTVTVSLAQQAVRLTVTAKTTGLFIDVAVNDTPIAQGVIARHADKIVREKYLGFTGDLAFYDLQGQSDPQWAGIGSRWVLVYDDAA